MALDAACREATLKCIARLDCLASNRQAPEVVASEATTVALAYLDIVGWETELDASAKQETLMMLTDAHWTSSTSYALGLRLAGTKQATLAPPALPRQFSTQLADTLKSAWLANDTTATMQLPAAAAPAQTMRALRGLQQRGKRLAQAPNDALLAAVITTGAQCDGETSRVVKAWSQLCQRPNLLGRKAMATLATQVRTSIAQFVAEAGEPFADLPVNCRVALLKNVVAAWQRACAFATAAEADSWSAVHRGLCHLAAHPLYASGGVPKPQCPFPDARSDDAAEVSFARRFLRPLGDDVPRASTLLMQPELAALFDFIRQAYEATRGCP